jgi:hypothetical protein
MWNVLLLNDKGMQAYTEVALGKIQSNCSQGQLIFAIVKLGTILFVIKWSYMGEADYIVKLNVTNVLSHIIRIIHYKACLTSMGQWKMKMTHV